MFAVPSIGCSYERTSGGQASLGALPRSYQVTPAILGRRRATKAVEVRPRSTGTAGVSPSPPENQPARSDARRRPWIYGDSDCNRLARHGLLGRTRPYRERGSAPHHLWPTRRGEAMACGGPPPRGGERHEPNPLFLAHAAGLSEIYVALETTLAAEFKLTRFEREAEAREPFETRTKRHKRAIAPDAFIEIEDADGHELLAFIELDMGTMSHRRLKRKAAGYAGYVKAGAWRERHHFCSALLFLTTTEKRARSFLVTMRREL